MHACIMHAREAKGRVYVTPLGVKRLETQSFSLFIGISENKGSCVCFNFRGGGGEKGFLVFFVVVIVAGRSRWFLGVRKPSTTIPRSERGGREGSRVPRVRHNS